MRYRSFGIDVPEKRRMQLQKVIATSREVALDTRDAESDSKMRHSEGRPLD